MDGSNGLNSVRICFSKASIREMSVSELCDSSWWLTATRRTLEWLLSLRDDGNEDAAQPVKGFPRDGTGEQ